jgi:diguanylate cyclase (GGDEF)-like protein/PAS domain S-box-containing protein
MAFLAFTTEQTDLSVAYHGHHTLALVILSLLIAILAAFTSFSHRALIQHASSRLMRYVWLSSGAVAMGLGVWAMHFTGMMSLQLPVNVDYQVTLTLLSLLPAVLASYVTLYVVAMPQATTRHILVGGVLMGAGIGIMHYTGMAAMVMQAERLYQPLMFALSIAGAILLATLSLSIKRWLAPVISRPAIQEMMSSVVMGLAIASMHYMAMHATVYLPLTDNITSIASVISKQTLGTLAVVVAVSILLLATITVLIRQQVQLALQSRARAKSKAEQLDARWQRIAARVPGMVYEFHMADNGTFTFPYASEAIRDIYLISPEQAKQDAFQALEAIYPDDRASMLESIYQSAREMTPWRHEYRVLDAQGQVRWVFGNALPERDDAGISWTGFITDITQRKAVEQQIHQLAYFDSLTGLYNRRKIQQTLQELCAESEPVAQSRAVLLINVDNFKRINDTLGHKAGDNLLIQLAKRLESIAPKDSACGRLSSDEFVMLITCLPNPLADFNLELEKFSLLLRSALQQPYDINGHYFKNTLSVGYCVFNDSVATADELLKRAEIAVSHVKAAGGNGQLLFASQMYQQQQHRNEIELALAGAVAANQLSVHYQPQVANDGAVTGVEALLRWQHPELGSVSPALFIPLAEENGQIAEIGYWVLHHTCQQLKLWQADPQLAGLTMSVNISARQFYMPDFVSIVEQCLKQYQLSPHLLILELTESLVLANLDDAVARMAQIKQLGVRFSMDDFGTGYSSLSYLSRLPFDEVKIDQYFVRSGSSGNPRDWVIVDAIIGIANTYGMKLVAEGVETEAQHQLLQQSGCLFYQGYLFSRPVAAASVETWIKHRNSRLSA